MYEAPTQAALIEFAHIVPGATVVDVYPGDGDWTRLFSEAVGPEGEVVSFVPTEIADIKPDQLDQMRAIAGGAVDQNIAPLSADLLELSKVSPQADVVWLHLFYHDLHTALIQKRGASADGFTKAVLATLKPGGCFVVVDHAAAAGSQLDATQSLHRIDPETVRNEIEAVGFTFDAATAILANASDPHTGKVFDPAIKGKTDRMAYRFLKR